MSWPDYKASQKIELEGYSFYSLIMAAMRKADTDNLALLKSAWPFVWEDLQERYKAPGGFLSEREMEEFGEFT